MPRVQVPIPLGFYTSPSPTINTARCINWIPVVTEKPSLSRNVLLQPSGITQFADTLLGACRGAWVMATGKRGPSSEPMSCSSCVTMTARIRVGCVVHATSPQLRSHDHGSMDETNGPPDATACGACQACITRPRD